MATDTFGDFLARRLSAIQQRKGFWATVLTSPVRAQCGRALGPDRTRRSWLAVRT